MQIDVVYKIRKCNLDGTIETFFSSYDTFEEAEAALLVVAINNKNCYLEIVKLYVSYQ